MNEQTFKALFPNASRALVEANRGLLDTQPQQDQETALDTPTAGAKEGVERVIVRFTGYRCRPLDPDSFAGSTKDLLDGLRRAKLLHDDSWWHIKLETEQVRVAKKAQERTEIEVIYP